jgi:hypothetical protein
MFALVKDKVFGWLKNVVGDAISSKKTLAAIVAVVALYAVNQKYAMIAFIVWMVCQTAVDVAKILKGQNK